MSHKSVKIAEQVRHLQGSSLDPRFLGYFECFNRQQFYEAHDVLEDLWLESRDTAKADFYKALIQLAGAFVHLQKDRLLPSGALFRLARAYLEPYAPVCDGLNVVTVLQLIDDWQEQLRAGNWQCNPLAPGTVPNLHLEL